MQKMPRQVRLSLRDNKTSVLLREVVTLRRFFKCSSREKERARGKERVRARARVCVCVFVYAGRREREYI